MKGDRAMTAFHIARLLGRRVLFPLACLALFVPAASAQTPPSDPAFATLNSRLKTGDSVTVTGPDLGTIRGRLIGLTPELLTVGTPTGPLSIPANRVDRVTRRRFGVLLGTILGAGVGVGLAIPLSMLYDNEGGDKAGDITKLVAVTTGIGFGIDAAINLPRTVYRRDAPLRVRVAPLVAPGGAGVAMRVTF